MWMNSSDQYNNMWVVIYHCFTSDTARICSGSISFLSPSDVLPPPPTTAQTATLTILKFVGNHEIPPVAAFPWESDEPRNFSCLERSGPSLHFNFIFFIELFANTMVSLRICITCYKYESDKCGIFLKSEIDCIWWVNLFSRLSVRWSNLQLPALCLS